MGEAIGVHSHWEIRAARPGRVPQGHWKTIPLWPRFAAKAWVGGVLSRAGLSWTAPAPWPQMRPYHCMNLGARALLFDKGSPPSVLAEQMAMKFMPHVAAWSQT